MSIRIKIKNLVRAWEEAEEKNALFAPNDALSERTIDNATQFSSGILVIEDATNMNLPLPDIQTVLGFWIQSDVDIQVSIDGDPAKDIKKASVGTSDDPTYAEVFWEGPVTTVNIAKPTTVPTSSARVRYAVWGNPTT